MPFSVFEVILNESDYLEICILVGMHRYIIYVVSFK